MIKKRYEVSFLVDEDSSCYAQGKEYDTIIETTLLDNFRENGSMEECDEIYVGEIPCDKTGAVNFIRDWFNKFSNYEDLSIEYQRLTYIPGKSKNAENIEKWCKENKKCLVCYKTVRSPETLNIILTSNWFGKIVSEWKKGAVIHTKTHGIGTIFSDEPFVYTGDLCVNVDFNGDRDTFECWKLLEDIDEDAMYTFVKERKQKELYDKYTFWDIVEKINWEWLCKQEGIKPYDKAHEILINLGYDDNRIAEIGKTAKAYRVILQNAIREYSQKEYGKRYSFPHVSDDSFWDLTAHIVGLGENVYRDILANPQKIKTYADTYNFTENFEYSFSSRKVKNPNNVEIESIGEKQEQSVVGSTLSNISKKKNVVWVNEYLK